jgi:hypothetical protein
MTFSIEVENKFEMTRREIQVRHKSLEEILEEQRIINPVVETGYGEEERRKVSFSLGSEGGEKDYLEISVDNQKSDLGPCKIDIWSNISFSFIPPGTAKVTVIPSEDGETNTSVKIPSGLSTWKFDIMRSIEQLCRGDDTGTANVTVGEDEPGGWDQI